MAEWGRKEYSKRWPSQTPVWTISVLILTGVFFAGALALDYLYGWIASERLYLADYLKSGLRGKASSKAVSKYTLLEGVVGKGRRFLIDDEIEPVTGPDGRRGYRLTEEGVRQGVARLEWVTGTFSDRAVHIVLSHGPFRHDDVWSYLQTPVYSTLAFFVIALFVAVPKDRARRMIWKHGPSFTRSGVGWNSKFQPETRAPRRYCFHQ
jgi:hypothetical protein